LKKEKYLSGVFMSIHSPEIDTCFTMAFPEQHATETEAKQAGLASTAI